jgi:hypothetical protein
MWGIRALRAGLLLGGLFAVVAGSGCCKCCKNLCGRETAPPPGSGAEREMTPAERHAATGFWFGDQPSHLKPENLHGGIY